MRRRERRSSSTSRAEPATGAAGDVPDWSGSGSEEIAMKEEVVYNDEAGPARSLRQKRLEPQQPL